MHMTEEQVLCFLKAMVVSRSPVPEWFSYCLQEQGSGQYCFIAMKNNMQQRNNIVWSVF